jgi:hypothetical protein
MHRHGAAADCGRIVATSIALVTAVVITSCGSTATPSTSATPTRAAPSISATPKVIGSQRTVLTSLGLNIHSDASQTSSVVGTAAQGVHLTVLDYRPDNGGWYKVQGQSTTGWIVADNSLTASGTFNPYSSTERGFSVLIPDNWTFAEEPADVVFKPQQGQQSIVVRSAASSAALGSEAPPGYVSSSSQQEVVCGYTGQLDFYALQGSAQPASPTPTPSAGGSAQHLANYAAIRLRFDATHTMEIAYNYASKDQLQTFQDFYNSITFPFPQCQLPATPLPGAPAT